MRERRDGARHMREQVLVHLLHDGLEHLARVRVRVRVWVRVRVRVRVWVWVWVRLGATTSHLMRVGASERVRGGAGRIHLMRVGGEGWGQRRG